MNNVTIIKPKKTFSLNDFKEIWQYKELLYFFTWRDLKVRYKQNYHRHTLGADPAIHHYDCFQCFF